MSPPAMERLLSDVFDLLPLNRRDLGCVALVSTKLRDTVREVRQRKGSARGVDAYIDALAGPRFQALESLHLTCLDIHADPPVPVPRDMPRLRSLRVENFKPTPGVWALVASRAPALVSLRLQPVYTTRNQETVHAGIEALLASDLAARLVKLHIRGLGLGSWSEEVEAVSLPRVTDLALTRCSVAVRPGGLHAPSLRVACLDRPQQLSERSRRGVTALTWPDVRRHRWAHAGFDALESLTLLFLDLSEHDTPGLMESLRVLPASLRALTVRLDFWRLSGTDPKFRFGATTPPLTHMRGLRDLSVIMSFPVAGTEDLLTGGLLGAPTTLRHVTLQAPDHPAKALQHEYEAYLADGGDNDAELEYLQAEIWRLDRRRRLAGEAVRAALAAFPHAHFSFRGFYVFVPDERITVM